MSTITSETCGPGFPSHVWVRGLGGDVCGGCGATRPCCSASAQLSTERQAREAAESDAENLAHRLVTTLNRAEAAEKEVERLKGALNTEGHAYEASLSREDEWAAELDKRVGSIHEAQRGRLAAEAKLAALAKAMRQIRQSSMQGSWFWNAADEALSALPPPVPTEAYRPLNERIRCVRCGAALGYCECPPVPTEEGGELLSAEEAWQDLIEKDDRNSPSDYPEMALITFEELQDYMASALPTQAPQDVAGLVEALEAVRTAYMVAHIAQGIDPSTSESLRLAETALDAFRPSPISHETKALVLAAADNNRLAQQEPKYRFDGGRIYNRASGEMIPLDEPVFLFRARDRRAHKALIGYMDDVDDATHAWAIKCRAEDFARFAEDHPERMKEPDTDPAAFQSRQEGK